MKLRRDFQGRLSLQGLTLIELLAVVAIIFVLSAMLIPAPSGRRHSIATTCLGTQKDIGRAFSMFAEDNRNEIPYAGLRFRDSAGDAEYSWDDFIGVYLGMTPNIDDMRAGTIETNRMKWGFKALRCPADKVNRSRPTAIRRSYAMPRNHMGRFTIHGRKPEDSGDSLSPDARTGVGLFSDAMGKVELKWRPVAWNAQGIPTLQRTLTFDMILARAETLMLVERFDDGQQAGSASRMQVALDGPSKHLGAYPKGADEFGWREKFQGGGHINRTVWNYLFVDGHVEMLRPEATLGPGAFRLDEPQSGMWTIRAGD